MTDSISYDVILAPKGVSVADASDTRTFTLDVDVTTVGDALDEAVYDHVVDTGLLDPWAFRTHWYVAYRVRTDAAPEHRLRDALLSTEVPADRWDSDHVPVKFDLRDDRTGQWESPLLAIEEPVHEDLYHWKGQLKSDYTEVLYATARDLNEAMLRVAANTDPDLADRFGDNPLLGYYEFCQTCMSHGSQVASTVTDINW